MRTKNTNVSISIEEPFKEDVLERLKYAEILTKLLGTIEEPFVLSVSSPWGTGKTTFVKMWQQHLKNNLFPTVYFNSWQNQFGQDPFVSFMAEINKDIVANLDNKNSKATKYFSDAKKVGSVIVKRSIPALAKLATYGVLDINSISEDIWASTVSEIVNEQIKSYESNIETIAKFKDDLQKFVSELSTDSKNNKPLIFIVDELDRCRPGYVIDLLEKINHLFNIPNIIFVLVLDKAQIGHSIKTIYGDAVDVDGYMRRFVDLEYMLPKPPSSNYVKYLANEFDLQNLGLPSQEDIEPLKRIFAYLADVFNISLRAQNQCFTRVSIAFRTENYFKTFIALQFVILILLKAARPGKYQDFVERRIRPEEVIEIIKNPSIPFVDGDAWLASILEALIGSLPIVNNKQLEQLIEHHESKNQ